MKIALVMAFTALSAFAAEKNSLHVIDADGKECKAEILRQERIEKAQ